MSSEDLIFDAKASVDFLRKFHPQGPWDLVAIRPDRKKGLFAKTFDASSPESVESWIAQFQSPGLPQEEKRNIYFHVNPLRTRDKKAERGDVKALAWIHVDLDPEAGKDIEEERALYTKMLTGEPPDGIPGRPTVILFSGGGIQAFWRIQDPVLLDGTEDVYEDAKLYNVQVQQVYNADPSVVNIDRVMRLPGTLNFPDEAKRKKGRVVALARLIEFNENVYPVSSLIKGTPKKSSPSALRTFESASAKVSVDNIKRIESTDELDKVANALVPDWTKDLISNGYDHKDRAGNTARGILDKYKSPSEAMFAVVCELVRCRVPDDYIYGIITDSKFRISDCVLNKPNAYERYAFRQIERAHERAICPELAELNDKYAVIMNADGDCLIMSYLKDPGLDRERISYQSFAAFHNAFSNRKICVGTKPVGRGADKKEIDDFMPLGKWWTTNPIRRQYDQIVFSPGRDIPGCYNLWRGFAVKSVQGNLDPFLEHMRDNLCCGNEQHFDYMLNWMARAVQQPDATGEVAIVLRGKEGTGKGIWAREFGALFGPHFMQVTHPEHLVGMFNSHLKDCVLLFADEAFYAGDKKHESVLKGLVTERTMMITKKHVDSDSGRNYAKIIMASNNDWIVPAGPDARRYFVLDVGEDHRGDLGYWKKLLAVMNSGGREALLYYLLNKDISRFAVNDFPKTKALARQKLMSMSDLHEWWYGCLCEGQISKKEANWGEIPFTTLNESYIEYAKDIGLLRRSNSTRLGLFLKEVCPDSWPRFVRRSVGAKRPRYYEFPPLDECRESFSKKFGGPFDFEGFDDPQQRLPLEKEEDYDIIDDSDSDPIPF